jgi:hypothetical protein
MGLSEVKYLFSKNTRQCENVFQSTQNEKIA